MANNAYDYMAEAWNRPKEGPLAQLHRERLIRYRHEHAIVRVERPTRLDRAHALGYRAKPGFVIARSAIRRGGLRKRWIPKGRKPHAKGIARLTMGKSLQRLAEERTARRFPNLQVLNSYWVGEDGGFKYYEIILVDPHHPQILADPRIAWIADKQHKGRVYRGLTSAGARGRGLHKRGRGSERNRPSVVSKGRRGK